MQNVSFSELFCKSILADPGATSQDDAIFWGESLLQELKSPWELILTKPVPEVVNSVPLIGQKNIFSTQSAMRSSRVTLWPSYMKYVVAWPIQWEDCHEGFQKKIIQTKPRKSQALTWGLGTNTIPSIFSADLLLRNERSE